MTDLIPGQPVTGPRATITLRSSGRVIDAGGDVIGLAIDTDPPTVWHGYDGRVSLQIDTDHDPEYDPCALTPAETAELAVSMANHWLRLRDRALPEAAANDSVRAALRAARACIQQDRQALADSHTSETGLDEDGAAGVAEYDEVLAQIDEAEAEHDRLVAEVSDAVAERERCAKLCEANSARWDAIGGDGGASLECADLIRRANDRSHRLP